MLIGQEAQEDALDCSSLVSARYRIGGRELGHIGIIGPIRMDYAHLIPSIEYFAQLMGTILSQTTEQEDWSVDGNVKE